MVHGVYVCFTRPLFCAVSSICPVYFVFWPPYLIKITERSEIICPLSSGGMVGVLILHYLSFIIPFS